MTATTATGSTWARWRYAAKPASWPKLVVPSLLGQALGIAAGGVGWSDPMLWAALAFGVVFTLFDLLAIVFLNDWGDREVDAIKRRMFPDGCSPKTIPDGILPARAVLIGGLLAAAGLVATAVYGGSVLGRPHLGWLGIGAACTFQIYTFGPLRLNYRGGGEVVEMLGVGALLPLVHAYAQSGVLWHPAYTALGGFVLLAFASALASGLSDETSDRAGGKRTVVTMFGNTTVRRATEACLVLGIVTWVSFGLFDPDTPPVVPIVAAVTVLWHGLSMRRVSASATTDAFRAQARYKLHLHRAIWHGATVFAVLRLLWFYLV